MCKINAFLRDINRTMIEMDGPAAGLLSTQTDLFSRGGGQDSTATTGPAQRQSPWTLGPSPRTTDPQPAGDGSEPAGSGPSTAVVSGIPAAAAFSPRVGDGQFNASRPPLFYGHDSDASPPRLQSSNDYRSTSGERIPPNAEDVPV